MMTRGCGILMPVFSLPSSEGTGTFGPEAYQFVDALSSYGIKYWQILPLNAGNPQNGESPYFSVSAFAINPLYISLPYLVSTGLLKPSELSSIPTFINDEIQYEAVRSYKFPLLDIAAERFTPDQSFESFYISQRYWLDDYALFSVLQNENGSSWISWPQILRDHDNSTLKDYHDHYSTKIHKIIVIQYLAWSQWKNLRNYCFNHGVTIVGDMPIYVSLDSADVWANTRLFKLDQDKRPIMVSGVPPDFFSATGQLWNNPVYDWKTHHSEGFQWWIRRMNYLLSLYEIVRIDHFRGLVQYWEIPSGETSAINGSWQDVPTIDLFDTLLTSINPFPVICEDLGIITDDVREVMKHYGFPGMKVLQFAFGGDNSNPYLPHNIDTNCFVYTGTHDNLPTLGWLQTTATQKERDMISQFTGKRSDDFETVWDLIELALKSDAVVSVIPLQDILLLGAQSRINDPSRTHGNWKWRWDSSTYPLQKQIHRLAMINENCQRI